MSKWVKRETIGPYVSSEYVEIWDSPGWQINVTEDGRYILIDAEMPMIPASPVMGVFDTFDGASAHADELGVPDWSEWETIR